jgi:hypothetical protein
LLVDALLLGGDAFGSSLPLDFEVCVLLDVATGRLDYHFKRHFPLRALATLINFFDRLHRLFLKLNNPIGVLGFWGFGVLGFWFLAPT